LGPLSFLSSHSVLSLLSFLWFWRGDNLRGRRRHGGRWAWRGRGGRRRATLALTATRMTTSGTHRRPPSPPRQPRPRGAPTDTLLPHLDDHDHEGRPPTPSFPTSVTTRTSGAHRRPPSPPQQPRGRALPPPSAGSSTWIWAAAERCFFYFRKLIFHIGPFQPIQ
jgi:hypothetical protein